LENWANQAPSVSTDFQAIGVKCEFFKVMTDKVQHHEDLTFKLLSKPKGVVATKAYAKNELQIFPVAMGISALDPTELGYKAPAARCDLGIANVGAKRRRMVMQAPNSKTVACPYWFVKGSAQASDTNMTFHECASQVLAANAVPTLPYFSNHVRVKVGDALIAVVPDAEEEEEITHGKGHKGGRGGKGKGATKKGKGCKGDGGK
jgi:hypothetical protein